MTPSSRTIGASLFTTQSWPEIGDQPLSANSLDRVFKEVLTMPGPKLHRSNSCSRMRCTVLRGQRKTTK
jgi:hypothetical protein